MKNKLKKLYKSINTLRGKGRAFIYLKSGKKPWSRGYNEFKWKMIKTVISDPKVLEVFKTGKALPEKYCFGLDERVIEFPWLISQMPDRPIDILDAGSTLNHEIILDHPVFKNKKITIANIVPEHNCFYNRGISYILSDIRKMPFKGDLFDMITCISTLEHVGMDNTIIYSKENKYQENNKWLYMEAVEELMRVLKSGGKLLITVPFGVYENHRFFQQFDHEMVKKISDKFPSQVNETYFKYGEGWQKADLKAAADSHYFDIHTNKNIREDRLAAAQAVVCLEITKK
ncbi:MAG: hypothetical protein QG640_193 [Patescibacteria group bacterium]|nr:hypothetical protein [Patescibacteria group bacterium]